MAVSAKAVDVCMPVQIGQVSIGSIAVKQTTQFSAAATRAMRMFRVLMASTATLASSRRTFAPFGQHGGGSSAPGRQWVERADGSRAAIRGVTELELATGDAIVIETPGGGGYGSR